MCALQICIRKDTRSNFYPEYNTVQFLVLSYCILQKCDCT